MKEVNHCTDMIIIDSTCHIYNFTDLMGSHILQKTRRDMLCLLSNPSRLNFDSVWTGQQDIRLLF